MLEQEQQALLLDFSHYGRITKMEMKTIFPEYDNVEVRKTGLFYRFVKRAFDFTFSLLLLLLIGWFLIIVAIFVSISSHGTPLYKDKRVGRWGKELNVLKFRSMFVDANTKPEKYLNKEQLEQFKNERKVDNDPRVTKIGRLIRKTSIDELPQIINIFLGNMTFVGPRPITQQEFDLHFTPKQTKIYQSAKPGLTGYWQVSGRNDISFGSGERQRIELEYFRIRGIWTDTKILFKTIPAVLEHKGAK